MKNKRFVAAVMLPSVLFLFMFCVFPLIYGLGVSFFKYNPANTHNDFLGLANYKRLVQDPIFWKALKNTVVFAAAAVTLNILITLFLAKIISILRSKALKTLFRTILFLPCIAPKVGTALVWKYGILGTETGVLNQILGLFGIEPTNWFLTSTPLFAVIIVFTLWSDIGYNIVLFSAGIEGIPNVFNEAAALDGAGAFYRFWKVELPLLGRTFAFVAITTMADYFKIFAQFRVLAKDGGRNDTAMVLTNYVYKTSFGSFDMGYGSAIAAALFLVVFVVVMIQNRVMRADWSYE